MTKYRYDIDLSKYPYGTELEFANAPLEDLALAFEKTNIPISLEQYHKNYSDIIYDRSYLDEDSTVSIPKNHKMYGGEISTRLYKNAKQDWLEIEEMCKVLKENGAEINGYCSNHVSINLTPIKKINLFMETLTKIVAHYEQDMNLFYMGDYYFVRETKDDYARLIGTFLMSTINYLNFEDEDCFDQILHSKYSVFSRRDGINLRDYPYNCRMEIRYGNGTLNPKTVQNNINFSLKLVDAIDEEKFDLEKLTWQIAEEMQTRSYVHAYMNSQENYDKFEYLVDTISTSEEDRNDFMSQYEKVLSTRPKRK